MRCGDELAVMAEWRAFDSRKEQESITIPEAAQGCAIAGLP
jgi:hypothetical protein